MKATDIEEAISLLAEQPFDAAEFPFRLLEAFGNKETTLKRLRSGTSNACPMWREACFSATFTSPCAELARSARR